jgi:uncharacterized lipoprotein YehR (DUF1307 family)
MQKTSTFVFILSILLFSFVSCEKEEEEPTLYGSWVLLITDSEGLKFNAELLINADNSYNFIVLDQNTTHTDSYAEFTLQQDTMKIAVDADCDGTGIYEYMVSETQLSLIAVSDPCSPRIAALQGVWDKK